MSIKKRLISGMLAFIMTFTIIPFSTVKAETEEQINAEALNNNTEGQEKPETNIISEITDKREKNVKYFLKEDKTYQAVVYPVPVHYLENGKWKDINNNLSDKKDEENGDILQNNSNEYSVKISKNTKAKKLVRIQKGQYEVSWNFKDANKTSKLVSAAKGTVGKALTKDDKKKVLDGISSQIEFNDIYMLQDENFDMIFR
ncbi:hypothetical protein [Clostridium manihotivorum]|uniref:Uncharacterized protein n=1 Tax=Clostridium manihotivorum TaxID=2320868 RepID=A0A410DWZ0_9CLOT|nr:hypothetical protein [Clostridium manihotivorum]QAA33773.1 hypothetical protein C1I91_20260 [Clostridium manihotivorum]